MIAVAIIVVLLFAALLVFPGYLVAREARADEVTAGKRRLMAQIARHGEGGGG